MTEPRSCLFTICICDIYSKLIRAMTCETGYTGSSRCHLLMLSGVSIASTKGKRELLSETAAGRQRLRQGSSRCPKFTQGTLRQRDSVVANALDMRTDWKLYPRVVRALVLHDTWA